MNAYGDSSLLVSYYINDANSLTAQTLIHSTAYPWPFTGLHLLEMRSALALGIFRQVLTPAQAAAAWADVEGDLRGGRLVSQPVNWPPVYRSAANWAALHGPKVACRSLDVLHVTLARKFGVKEFFTFDARQKSLALALGLTVKP